ncbi:hypothetical protein ACFWUP_09520 [Nocardia sp. NPDC058658]|uniref:hypothetical protein n=1 Tax=Nocardia sp. NPDC058658 TaxID=3346580 RepID=UPI0036509816
MSKIRVFGVAMVAAASVAVLGGGVASAEEASTGSADLLEQLSSGTGEAEDVVEEEPSTGSADGLAALLKQLTSGSGEAEEVAEEPATGSAEGLDLGALLKQLTTGTAEGDTE